MGRPKRRRGNRTGVRIGLLAMLAVIGCLGLIFWFQLSDVLRYRRNVRRFRPLALAAAERHRVDPALVLAVIRQESRFNPDARGAAGELGLMQVTRDAAKDWENKFRRKLQADSDLLQPELNIDIGSWYLARACDRWKKSPFPVELALSEYNAGPQRAKKWAQDYKENFLEQVPIPSTRRYISKVLQYREEYRTEIGK